MTELEYLRQLFDERFDRDKERLDKDEKLIEELSACNLKRTAMIEAHEQLLANYGARLSAMEAKPGKRWDGMVEKMILTAAAAIAGVVLAKFGL